MANQQTPPSDFRFHLIHSLSLHLWQVEEELTSDSASSWELIMCQSPQKKVEFPPESFQLPFSSK
ncbi:uncharacterized protein G2W53_004608 [Senna tora]|uniref:Uncharacterized protein n=1 Tax=Senna tora TaxID=362788 RepID=A0A835CJI0_9FABA|nr:uncharacterized protein G2W53_004608 [Senna tora]